MKVLRNKYHKKLSFEVNNHPIGIDAYGTRQVEDEDAKILLENQWIELANPNTEKEIADTKIKEKQRPICKPCVEAQEKDELARKTPESVIYKKPKVSKYKGRNNN